jgi:hypothetical protein
MQVTFTSVFGHCAGAIARRQTQALLGGALLLGATLLPRLGAAQTVRTFDSGATLAPVTNPGPIYRSAAASTYYGSRYAYLYDAAEMAAAGIQAGATITQVEWEKADANSTTRPGRLHHPDAQQQQAPHDHSQPLGYADGRGHHGVQ